MTRFTTALSAIGMLLPAINMLMNENTIATTKNAVASLFGLGVIEKEGKKTYALATAKGVETTATLL